MCNSLSPWTACSNAKSIFFFVYLLFSFCLFVYCLNICITNAAILQKLREREKENKIQEIFWVSVLLMSKMLRSNEANVVLPSPGSGPP